MAGENVGKSRTSMGTLIKRYREGQGLTQRELAAAAGTSIGALRDLEQGRTRSPRWAMLEELAAVLDLGEAQRTELARAWPLSACSPARHETRRSGRPPPAGRPPISAPSRIQVGPRQVATAGAVRPRRTSESMLGRPAGDLIWHGHAAMEAADPRPRAPAPAVVSRDGHCRATGNYWNASTAGIPAPPPGTRRARMPWHPRPVAEREPAQVSRSAPPSG